MHPLHIVAQRFALLLLLTVVVLVLGFSKGRAAASDDTLVGQWTVVIPEAFPNDVFTWRLEANGTYEEDGRDAKSGEAIQPTYTGSWSAKDGRMVLRQNEITYVFDGLLSGERYAGTLTLSGRAVSHFCAAKGTTVPARCDAKDVITMLVPGR